MFTPHIKTSRGLWAEAPLSPCLSRHKQIVCICFSCENQWSQTDGGVVPHYLLLDSDKCPPPPGWCCAGKQENHLSVPTDVPKADVHSAAVLLSPPVFFFFCCLPAKHEILIQTEVAHRNLTIIRWCTSNITMTDFVCLFLLVSIETLNSSIEKTTNKKVIVYFLEMAKIIFFYSQSPKNKNTFL